MTLTTATRFGATASLILSLTLPAFTPAFAETTQVEAATSRIILAGRQRMLSQKIALAACRIHIGTDVEANLTVASDASALFETTHTALRSSSAALGLSMETSPLVLDALQEVDHSWSAYTLQIHNLMNSGALTADELATLDATGTKVLDDMTVAVGQTSRVYGMEVEGLSLLMSVTLDFAGRQRMLTQKMSKEFCLIDAGVDVETNRERLDATLTIFEVSLNGLIEGYPGMLAAAPNEEIHDKLIEVSNLWLDGRTTLDGIVAGSAISAKTRDLVAANIDALLVSTSEVAALYKTSVTD